MINQVVLVGRVTKDIELKYLQSGIPYAEFTVAINRPFANNNGEREADFVSCQVWNKQAENMVRYVEKGHLIGVVGSINTSNFMGKDGKQVYKTKVRVDSVQFLQSKKQDNNSSNANAYGFGNNFGNNNGNFGFEQFGSQQSLDMGDSMRSVDTSNLFDDFNPFKS